MIKIFDLFAGVGGFRLAAEMVFKKHDIDYKFVGWSEIDKYCQISYKANFKTENEFFVDDIKKITSSISSSECNERNFSDRERSVFIKKNIPGFNLLFAGFPCQSFSQMGNQQALFDDRGALFFDIAAIVNALKPNYFILENVSRILTIDNKKTIETIISALTSIGYQIGYFLLDTKDYGIPQTRRRVFIYGCRKSLKLSMPLLEPEKVRLGKPQRIFWIKMWIVNTYCQRRYWKQYLKMAQEVIFKNQK